MSKIRKRFYSLRKSLIAAKLLAKIGHDSLEDVPRSLPEKERRTYAAAIKKTLEKSKKEGLPWVQVAENHWVAQPRIEEMEIGGISEDVFFLYEAVSQGKKGPEQDEAPINHIAIEQFIIIILAQFDAYVQDILSEICRAQPSFLASGKLIRWRDISKAGSDKAAIEGLIQSFIGQFGYKSLPSKLDFLKNAIKLACPAELANDLLLAEQYRHVFIHSGGYASKQFVDKTKFEDCNIGDRLVADLQYCNSLMQAVLWLSAKIADAAIDKWWPDDKLPDYLRGPIDESVKHIGTD